MSQLIFLVLDFCVFAVVAFGVLVGARRVEATLSVRRRLQADEPKRTVASRLIRSQELRNPVLQWVQKTTLQDPEARTKLRRDLALAGFEHPSAPALYVMSRFCLAVGLPALFVFSQALSSNPMKGFLFIVVAVGLAVIGLIAPRGILDNRINARKTALENEFPDTLDLMVVCVESGLGLEGAIVRVGSETQESHPLISREFHMVSYELQAGRTRAEALRNMADRTQVEMIGSFVALLIQTDALGGSIASTLRTYSAEMRQHRMLRAEEKAMRLPVLLTVPLVLFILPVIMAAVLLPPVLDGIRIFFADIGWGGKMNTRSKLAGAVLATALVSGLGGCMHLPQLAQLTNLFRARPAPADLGPAPGPYGAEDRLYADAVHAIDKRNYGEAIGLLQVAREARPGDPRVLTAMGVVYDKLGRFDLSDRYYDQAEKADPGSRIVALDRRYSMVLRNAGKAEQSGAALAANDAPAPAGTPPAGEKLYAQAVAAIQKHEYGVAIGLLRDARDALPGDARILTALGVTYDHLGRFDLSSRYYDQAEKVDPGSALVAQDRRTSLILQQHGGFEGPDDIVVLAGAGPKPSPNAAPSVRVAKAVKSGDHG